MSSDFISFFEKKMDSMFNTESFDDHINKELTPLSHFIKRDSKWILEVDLPMVDKKNIKLLLSAHHLTIKARLKKTFCISKHNTITEFDYFKKVISLPEGADTKKITATFKKGLLRITIPKISEGKQIPIE